MNKVLFLIHGMGIDGEDWATPIVAQLMAAPDRYGYRWFDQNGAVTDHVDIVPVGYAGVFSRYRAEWSSSAAAVSTYAAAHQIAVPRVLTWLQDQSTGSMPRRFFWSDLVDVVLYRFITIVAAEVRLRVMHALVREVTTRMQSARVVEASVLAHGLGTSVAHDVLASLGSRPIDGNAAFTAGNFQFTNIFMVSNVSRALETDFAVYRSVVHPDTVRPRDAYCQRYYNFRHRLDLLAATRAFQPVKWGDDYVAVEDLDRVISFDVHGLSHYLDAPQVHVPIIRGLLGPVITKREYAAAADQYARQPEPDCVVALRDFKHTAGQLAEIGKSIEEPQEMVIAGSRFLATAKQAFDACHA
jgi:hypothetical protein